MYFESWGTEHVLQAGDVFYVQTAALSTGDVEVSHDEGGIVLGFTADVPIVVTDGTGKHLKI